MTPMREQLLRFIDALRAAGVSVSVAETLDAMRAVAAVGFERAPMREALATSLIKDEADRPLFDRTYAQFFGRTQGAELRKPERRSGARAAGGAAPQAGVGLAMRPPREPPEQRGRSQPRAEAAEAQAHAKPGGETESASQAAEGEEAREARGLEAHRQAR